MSAAGTMTGPGWFNDHLDVFVPEGKAFDYAMERIENGTQEEKEDFVEWFYRHWFHED